MNKGHFFSFIIKSILGVFYFVLITESEILWSQVKNYRLVARYW